MTRLILIRSSFAVPCCAEPVPSYSLFLLLVRLLPSPFGPFWRGPALLYPVIGYGLIPARHPVHGSTSHHLPGLASLGGADPRHHCFCRNAPFGRDAASAKSPG